MIQDHQEDMRNLLGPIATPSIESEASRLRNDSRLTGEDNSHLIPSLSSLGLEDQVDLAVKVGQGMGSFPQQGNLASTVVSTARRLLRESGQVSGEQPMADEPEANIDDDSSQSSDGSEEWIEDPDNPFGTRGGVLKKIAALRHDDLFADKYHDLETVSISNGVSQLCDRHAESSWKASFPPCSTKARPKTRSPHHILLG